jgi:hypothetical protein
MDMCLTSDNEDIELKLLSKICSKKDMEIKALKNRNNKQGLNKSMVGKSDQ